MSAPLIEHEQTPRRGIVGVLGGRRHVRRAGWVSLLTAVLVAVACAMLASGSHEFLTGFGDLPVNPQDEVRVSAEVWFTLATAVLAVLTTMLWWFPIGNRADQSGDGRRLVERARGPLGLVITTGAAVLQTAVALLVWKMVVVLRGFDGGEPGIGHLAAPVISSTAALWVAGLVAVLTYLVLVIVAPTSDLAREPAEPLDVGPTHPAAEQAPFAN